VGSWSVAKLELQRRADLAAYEAANLFRNGSTARIAEEGEAMIAALNGATATGCSWSRGHQDPDLQRCDRGAGKRCAHRDGQGDEEGGRQARGSTLDHYVHRHARLGTWVLISESWYKALP
jgi:hypothetical protein